MVQELNCDHTFKCLWTLQLLLSAQSVCQKLLQSCPCSLHTGLEREFSRDRNSKINSWNKNNKIKIYILFYQITWAEPVMLKLINTTVQINAPLGPVPITNIIPKSCLFLWSSLAFLIIFLISWSLFWIKSSVVADEDFFTTVVDAE